MSQTETIAECPYRLDGLPDTSHGWYFVAEQQKGKEYLPFEGWFESKGGKIQSPQIRLNKTKGTAGFFTERGFRQTAENAEGPAVRKVPVSCIGIDSVPPGIEII